MKKYKISVVICVADDIRIKNMLDSINEFCEVLVVLNGATENVKKIVNDYKKNAKFILNSVEINERNLSKARNIGMLKSKYNKVLFYDSDCIMTDTAIDNYDRYLDKYLIVDGSVKFRDDFFQSKIVSVQRSMGLKGYALCPSIGINKKISKYIDYYFDEDIKWIEDSELNIRIHKQNINIGVIDELTCVHDNLTFCQDLKSAYRYGTGVKLAARKGLHKKRPTANWNLIIPCMKKNILSGLYCLMWNLVYCYGYFIK